MIDKKLRRELQETFDLFMELAGKKQWSASKQNKFIAVFNKLGSYDFIDLKFDKIRTKLEKVKLPKKVIVYPVKKAYSKNEVYITKDKRFLLKWEDFLVMGKKSGDWSVFIPGKSNQSDISKFYPLRVCSGPYNACFIPEKALAKAYHTKDIGKRINLPDKMINYKKPETLNLKSQDEDDFDKFNLRPNMDMWEKT